MFNRVSVERSQTGQCFSGQIVRTALLADPRGISLPGVTVVSPGSSGFNVIPLRVFEGVENQYGSNWTGTYSGGSVIANANPGVADDSVNPIAGIASSAANFPTRLSLSTCRASVAVTNGSVTTTRVRVQVFRARQIFTPGHLPISVGGFTEYGSTDPVTVAERLFERYTPHTLSPGQMNLGTPSTFSPSTPFTSAPHFSRFFQQISQASCVLAHGASKSMSVLIPSFTYTPAFDSASVLPAGYPNIAAVSNFRALPYRDVWLVVTCYSVGVALMGANVNPNDDALIASAPCGVDFRIGWRDVLTNTPCTTDWRLSTFRLPAAKYNVQSATRGTGVNIMSHYGNPVKITANPVV